MTCTTARTPQFFRAAGTALLIGILAGCSSESALPAPEAAKRYPAIVDELADALDAQVAPLTSDGGAPQVSSYSEGCRITGATYESDDLLGEDGSGGPTTDQIAETTDTVLAQYGFDAIAFEDERHAPMELLVSEDDTGGAVRVVLESRPDRPTLRLWWSAHVDTEGAECDQSLLD